MTANEFRLWIRGYLSLSDEGFLDNRQVSIIQNHANLVAAVTGKSEPAIEEFIFKLTSECEHDSTISIERFKRLAVALNPGF